MTVRTQKAAWLALHRSANAGNLFLTFKKTNSIGFGDMVALPHNTIPRFHDSTCHLNISWRHCSTERAPLMVETPVDIPPCRTGAHRADQ